MRPLVMLLLFSSFYCTTGSSARAQLFSSDRTVGRSSNLSPSSMRPQARFERQNRRQAGFVGADRQDQSGFVGAAQAIAPSRASSVRQPNLRRTAGRGAGGGLNTPRRADAANSEYSPSLELVADDSDLPGSEIAGGVADRDLTERFSRLPAFADGTSQVRVTARQGTVVLDGEVATDAQRDLAATLMALEPGVDRVQNRLRVLSALPTPQ